MKHAFALMSVVVFSACGGGPSSESVCANLIKDDLELARGFQRDGIEALSLCACVGSSLDEMTKSQRDSYVQVMTAVTEIRHDYKIGVEEASTLLQKDLYEPNNAYGFGETEFYKTGRLLNDVSDQLEDTGSCAVS